MTEWEFWELLRRSFVSTRVQQLLVSTRYIVPPVLATAFQCR